MTAAIETLVPLDDPGLAQAPTWATGVIDCVTSRRQCRSAHQHREVRGVCGRRDALSTSKTGRVHSRSPCCTPPTAPSGFAVTVRGQWLCRRPRELQIQRVAGPRNQIHERPATLGGLSHFRAHRASPPHAAGASYQVDVLGQPRMSSPSGAKTGRGCSFPPTVAGTSTCTRSRPMPRRTPAWSMPDRARRWSPPSRRIGRPCCSSRISRT